VKDGYGDGARRTWDTGGLDMKNII